MTGHRNLDQRRACHAWRLIEQVKQQDDKAKQKFKIQAKRLPVRIMTAGLGQALAFLEAKRYAPLLLEALKCWIDELKLSGSSNGNSRLIHQVIHGDSDFLRITTAECLAYLQWVVRFAEAELADVDDNGEN